MLSFLFIGVVVLAGCTSAQDEACGQGLQTCNQNFMQSFMKHAQENKAHLVCDDMDDFIECLEQLDCGVPQGQKDQMIAKIRQDATKQGIDCENRGGDKGSSSSTTVSPKYKSATCEGAIEVCGRQLMEEFSSAISGNDKPKDPKWACQPLQSFADCLLESKCDVSKTREAIEQQMKNAEGVECDLKFGDKNDGGDDDGNNPATKLQYGVTIILTTAVAALTCIKIF